MDKNRKRLLLATILIIVYTVGYFIYLNYNHNLISKNPTENILNIISIGMVIYSVISSIQLIFFNKEDLKTNKNKLTVITVLYFLINIVSGIIGITICNRLDKKEVEEKPIPREEDVKGFNKYIYLLVFIISLVIMFVIPYIFHGPVAFLLSHLVILSLTVIAFHKQLITNFKSFIKNFKSYNKLVLKTWVKALVTLLLVSIGINLITHLDGATNQIELTKMFNKKPLLIAFLAIIYAPISEELLFRGVFKKFINNKWVFIITSGFIFGLLHVIDDFSNIKELLYILAYGSLGCYLAGLYYKTNNICTNIYLHMLQNTLSIIGMILLKFM